MVALCYKSAGSRITCAENFVKFGRAVFEISINRSSFISSMTERKPAIHNK